LTLPGGLFVGEGLCARVAAKPLTGLFRYGESELDPAIQAEILLESARNEARVAVLEVILEDQDILGHCARMGEHFRKSLEDLQGGCPTIKEIRGMGLLIGIEVSCDARELVEGLRKRGVLANATSDRVLRFVPPLIVSQAEIDRVVATLGDVIQASR